MKTFKVIKPVCTVCHKLRIVTACDFVWTQEEAAKEIATYVCSDHDKAEGK